MVFAVLDNDKDADGNKLKSYLYLHQRMGENDTITFEPSMDFVGTDKFSYVIRIVKETPIKERCLPMLEE